MVGFVMQINDYFLNAAALQPRHHAHQQALTGNLGQRLGRVIGRALHARALAGGQNHRPIYFRMFNQFAAPRRAAHGRPANRQPASRRAHPDGFSDRQ